MAEQYDNVSDELDALINGTHDGEAEDELDTNNEDTEYTDDTTEDTETNDQAAEQGNDTDDEVVDDGTENAPVDSDGSEEPDVDEGEGEGEIDVDADGGEPEADTNDGADELEADVDADGDKGNMDTDGDGDGSDPKTTDDIDYREKYETLMADAKDAIDFRDNVAGVKFKANGKEVEGFKDPAKIIQAQQMAYNYSEKMAGFKQYRPYMGPLKDRGMLDDPSKFDLAMSLSDGDKEALKQHISNLGIDPMELDMEDIKYAGESKTVSRDVIAIEDALESAKASGVEDQVYNTVMKEWDDDSFRDFVGNQAIQEDLIAQMVSGEYDKVMGKVEQMSVLDTRFSGMKMVDKYRAAINEINSELVVPKDEPREVIEPAAKVNTGEVDEALARDRAKAEVESKRVEIENKAVEAYKAEIKRKRNAKAKADRDKANNASKPKPASTSRNKVDPMDYSGTEMASFLDSMIMGKK